MLEIRRENDRLVTGLSRKLYSEIARIECDKDEVVFKVFRE